MIWRREARPADHPRPAVAGQHDFLFTYRVQYVSRLQDLASRQEQAQAQLEQARNARITAEQHWPPTRKLQAELQVLYNERWSTPMMRLTALIDEVKRLRRGQPPPAAGVRVFRAAHRSSPPPIDPGQRGDRYDHRGDCIHRSGNI